MTLTEQALPQKAACTCPCMAAGLTLRMLSSPCAHMPALNIREPQRCQVCLRPLPERSPDAQPQPLKGFGRNRLVRARPSTAPWEYHLRYLHVDM